MKKTILIILAIVLVVAIVVATCLLLPKKNNDVNENTQPTEDVGVPPHTVPSDFDTSLFPSITPPGPENPEEFLHECFDIAKDVLGEHYYPNVAVEPEKIPEMFGVNSEDYLLAFAQICDDKSKADMIVAIQCKDAESMNRVLEALRAYAQKMGTNEAYPEHVRTALNVYMTTTDVWNYVFLVTTFGDLDSVADKTEQEIKEFAENNAMKVISAIRHRDKNDTADPNQGS